MGLGASSCSRSRAVPHARPFPPVQTDILGPCRAGWGPGSHRPVSGRGAALYMLRPDDQIAELDSRVRAVGHGLGAAVTDRLSASSRTAGGHTLDRNGPCRPLYARLPTFWAGVGLPARGGGPERSGGPWRASVVLHDNRSARRLGSESAQHCGSGWRQVGRGRADKPDPVELSSSEESLHGSVGFEGGPVGRPDEACFFDHVDDLSAPALSELESHDPSSSSGLDQFRFPSLTGMGTGGTAMVEGGKLQDPGTGSHDHREPTDLHLCPFIMIIGNRFPISPEPVPRAVPSDLETMIIGNRLTWGFIRAHPGRSPPPEGWAEGGGGRRSPP